MREMNSPKMEGLMLESTIGNPGLKAKVRRTSLACLTRRYKARFVSSPQSSLYEDHFLQFALPFDFAIPRVLNCPIPSNMKLLAIFTCIFAIAAAAPQVPGVR